MESSYSRVSCVGVVDTVWAYAVYIHTYTCINTIVNVSPLRNLYPKYMGAWRVVRVTVPEHSRSGTLAGSRPCATHVFRPNSDAEAGLISYFLGICGHQEIRVKASIPVSRCSRRYTATFCTKSLGFSLFLFFLMLGLNRRSSAALSIQTILVQFYM